MYQDAYSLKIGAELALFAIARTWKQCPLADEWIKKPWYIYTIKYVHNIHYKMHVCVYIHIHIH